MYKALASIDTLVKLPSGKIAVVVAHLDGNDIALDYLDGSGSLDINSRYLRPASASDGIAELLKTRK